jgi:cytochrome d ubiquinol oxidase subunit I
MALTPAGFVAVPAGWFVTEIGRQPYMVYGVLRTAESASPVIATPIFLSIVGFIITYVFIFGAGSYYILTLIGKGPDSGDHAYGDHGLGKPAIAPGLGGEKGGSHV